MMFFSARVGFQRWRILAVLLVVVASMALGACATNPTGRSSFTGLMSAEEEARIGAEEHPKILEQFGGVYDDPELQAYIARMGGELLAASEGKGKPYTFTILNSDIVNAFALPGGYVYITRGLLALAETEAEVASVLAHEIGHVTARHPAERYSQTMAANVGMSILGAIGSAYGVPGTATNVASIGAIALLRSYSREQELESDLLGIRYMTRVKYDPQGSVGFFQKMKAQDELVRDIAGNGGKDIRGHIMSTHPRTTDRIEQAIKLAREKEPMLADVEARVDRAAYLRRIDGMLFGDDPDEGVRRGRAFVHPGLGIRFEVPEGFELFNSSKNVAARARDKSVILYDMEGTKKAKAVGDLKRYLTQTWAPKAGLKDVERITINGMEAATGAARVRMSAGVRDLRLIAIKERWGRIHRFAFITEVGRGDVWSEGFRRTTYSFRTLSEQEKAAVKPLRVRLKKVAAGDTVAKLAATGPFAGAHNNESWFRIANGLGRDEKLAPGRLVKVIR